MGVVHSPDDGHEIEQHDEMLREDRRAEFPRDEFQFSAAEQSGGGGGFALAEKAAALPVVLGVARGYGSVG